MKAKEGNKIKLIEDVSYGSAYGLIKLPKGTELTVVQRMESDDGIKTGELFHYDGIMGKTSFSYRIWDEQYKIVTS